MSRSVRPIQSLLLAVSTLALLAIGAPQPLVAQGVVETIRIEGGQRVDPGAVRSYLTIREGQPATPAQINESVKRLYATGLFSEVRVVPQNGTLVVTVRENPIINQVSIEGNRRLKDAVLLPELVSRERRAFTKSSAESDAQTIIEAYRRAGLYGTAVEPKLIELDQNRVDLVFEVIEGPNTEVQSIRFIGNRVFSDTRLRREIATDESAWWRILSTTDTYDPDRLEFDKELLRQFYLNRGYADFQITSAVAEIAPDQSGFFITFVIDEGQSYEFGDISVASNVAGVEVGGLESVVQTDSGRTYNASLVEKTISDLSFELGERGYAFTKIVPKPQKNDDTKTIDLIYEVNEGARAFVERIDIEGNSRTLDRVIRREFELVEGDAFNAVQIRRSRSNIRKLGFFSKVDIATEEGSAPDRVVVRTTVEETSTGQLSFGAGFSSSENVAGEVSITERNLLGRGQFLRLRGRLSGAHRLVDLSFTEPAFLGRDIAAGVDIFYDDKDNTSSSSYNLERLGIRPRVSFNLDNNTRLGLRYEFSQNNLKNVPDSAAPSIQDDEGEYLVSALGYTLVHDRRNDPIEPNKGYIMTFKQDVAGLGGDTKYVKTTASAKAHQWLVREDVIGSVEIEGGAVLGWGDYELKTSDRFQLGGDNLRGFRNSGVGPRHTDGTTYNDAVGGEYFAVARTEVTFPLGLPEELGIAGGVFADVGTVWNLSERMTDTYGINDDMEVRASAGASLFWSSPIGPIRMNFARPLVKEDGDETEFFRFTAGTRF